MPIFIRQRVNLPFMLFLNTVRSKKEHIFSATLCFQDLLAAKLSFQTVLCFLVFHNHDRLECGHFMLPAPAILWVK